MQLLGEGGDGASGDGVVVSCPGAAGKRWNSRQPCRRRRDPSGPQRPTTLSAASVGFDRCTHAPIEVIRRSISSRRRTKRPHLFSLLLLPTSDAVAAIVEYSLPMVSGSVISIHEHESGPFKSVPASVHRSVPALTVSKLSYRISSRHTTRPALFHHSAFPPGLGLVVFPDFAVAGSPAKTLCSRRNRSFSLIFGPGTGLENRGVGRIGGGDRAVSLLGGSYRRPCDSLPSREQRAHQRSC